MTLLDGGASAIHAPSKVSADSATAVWLKNSVIKSAVKSECNFMSRVLIIEVQIINAGWLTGKYYVFLLAWGFSVQGISGTAKISIYDNYEY